MLLFLLVVVVVAAFVDFEALKLFSLRSKQIAKASLLEVNWGSFLIDHFSYGGVLSIPWHRPYKSLLQSWHFPFVYFLHLEGTLKVPGVVAGCRRNAIWAPPWWADPAYRLLCLWSRRQGISLDIMPLWSGYRLGSAAVISGSGGPAICVWLQLAACKINSLQAVVGVLDRLWENQRCGFCAVWPFHLLLYFVYHHLYLFEGKTWPLGP